MKMNFLTLTRHVMLSVVVFLQLLTISLSTSAQLCADPSNVIYGLSNAGFIYPIPISTGIVGAQINPAYSGNAPLASNGLGYNQLNGKFYYFKRPPGSSPQEFVSFDPATNAYTILASCPTSNSVYVGCLTPDGLGYYCWDSNATLFYYRISTNVWRTITTVIRDQAGNDVSAIIRAHGSGDATVDGSGNLYMLPSSNTKYALFRLSAPLPTTNVASITVTEVIPLTNPPAKFGGIALNSTGQIILSGAAPNNRLYRLESNLSLTPLVALTSDMGDLTSCNFPMFILPSAFHNFSALVTGSAVHLSWDKVLTGEKYNVEHSVDGKTWKKIGNRVTENSGSAAFTHLTPSLNVNYYRLSNYNGDGKPMYSETKVITWNAGVQLRVWPNPVLTELHIESRGRSNAATTAVIYEMNGRKVKEVVITGASQVIPVQELGSGSYFVRFDSSDGSNLIQKFIKK